MQSFYLRIALAGLLAAAVVESAGPARADSEQLVRVLNACQTQADLKYFATRLQAVDLRLSPEHGPAGGLALRLEFFTGVGASDPEPKVLCTYAGGGFALANWRPYDVFAFDAYNPHEFSEVVHLRLRDDKAGEGHLEYSLQPGRWTTVRVPIAGLAEKIDVAHLASMVFFLRADEMKRRAQVVHLNRLRLIGSDRQGIEKAAELEGSIEDRRTADPRISDRAEYLPEFLSPQAVATYRLSTTVPVVAEAEVIVVGGGAAGVPAAVAAARNGADVLLVEATGCLGGTATFSFPLPLYGSGHLDRGGIFAELDRSVAALRGLALDPEARKRALDQAVAEAGVKVLFGAMATDVILGRPSENGLATIDALVLETRQGRWAVRGKIFVDCTGDADLAAAAGAPFEMGRGRDDYTQAMSRLFYIGQGNKARHNNLMTGTVAKVNPTDVRDLTYAEVHGRGRALAHFQDHAPSQYLLTSPQIGIRESRRIIGDYVLTGSDVVSGARFDDVVALCRATMDSWCAEGQWGKVYTDDVNSVWLEGSYDIPFRCLVPGKVGNLLVAGRAISVTHAAQSSARLQPTCGLLGQAAGTAAAICTRLGLLPRQLDVGRLQCILVRQGVVLREGIPSAQDRAAWNSAPLPPGPGRSPGCVPAVKLDPDNPRVSWVHDVPVVCRTQVLVVGGSPAGMAAAVASARAGARTLLVERAGFLGGSLAEGVPLRLPSNDPRAEGLFANWCAEMKKAGVAVGELADPEYSKHVTDRLIARSGVKLLLRALPIDVMRADQQHGTVGLIVHTKSGPLGIAADCIVDGTTEAVVAAMAGARFRGPGSARWRRAFFAGVTTDEGLDPPPKLHWGPSRRWLCGTVEADAAPPLAFTKAELETRRKLFEEILRIRKLPGYENTLLLRSSFAVERTNPRHIEALATLGADVSEVGGAPCVPVATTSVGPVPLGCLMPRGCPRLLVAGQAIAATSASSQAVEPVIAQMAIGDAAGRVAAVAAQTQQEPANLSPQQLKAALATGQ